MDNCCNGRIRHEFLEKNNKKSWSDQTSRNHSWSWSPSSIMWPVAVHLHNPVSVSSKQTSFSTVFVDNWHSGRLFQLAGGTKRRRRRRRLQAIGQPSRHLRTTATISMRPPPPRRTWKQAFICSAASDIGFRIHIRAHEGCFWCTAAISTFPSLTAWRSSAARWGGAEQGGQGSVIGLQEEAETVTSWT